MKDGAYAGWDRYYPADSPIPYAPAVRASGCYELARNWRFGLELAAEPARPFTLACLGPDGLFRGEGLRSSNPSRLACREGAARFQKLTWEPCSAPSQAARVARAVRCGAGLHHPRGGPMSRDERETAPRAACSPSATSTAARRPSAR